MPVIIKGCKHCRKEYSWNTELFGNMPESCPLCGYNEKQILSDSGVSNLIRMLHSSNPTERNHAAATLGDLSGDSAINALISVLDDSELSVVLPAVISLGRISPRAKNAVGPLIRVMNRGTKYGPSFSAAMSLLKIGTPEAKKAAVAHIVKLSQFDVDGESFRETVIKLKDRGDESVQLLIDLIRIKDVYCRQLVILALQIIGDKKTVDAILPFIHDEDKNVRKVAFDTCFKLGWSTPAAKQVKAYISDGGSSESIKHLDLGIILPLIDDKDKNVRKVALDTCLKLGWSPSTAEQVIAYIKNEIPVESIKHLDLNVVKSLVDVLVQNKHDHEYAFRALLQIKWLPNTVEEAIAYLNSGGNAESITHLWPQLIHPLIRSLKTESLTYNCKKSMGAILVEKAAFVDLEIIMQGLNDAIDDKTKLFAIQRYIKHRGESSSVTILIKYLTSDNSGNIRKFAALRLASIGSSEAIPSLIKRLCDIKVEVQEACAYALGELKAQEAIDSLQTIFEDTDRNMRIREVAADALSKITGQKYVVQTKNSKQIPNNGLFTAIARLVSLLTGR